jgi:hypothetical protein
MLTVELQTCSLYAESRELLSQLGRVAVDGTVCTSWLSLPEARLFAKRLAEINDTLVSMPRPELAYILTPYPATQPQAASAEKPWIGDAS